MVCICRSLTNPFSELLTTTVYLLYCKQVSNLVFHISVTTSKATINRPVQIVDPVRHALVNKLYSISKYMCSSSAKIYRRSTSIQLTEFSTKLLWQIFVSNAISPPGSELWIDHYGPVQIDRYSSNHLWLNNGNVQYFHNYTGDVTLFGKCFARRRHIYRYRDPAKFRVVPDVLWSTP